MPKKLYRLEQAMHWEAVYGDKKLHETTDLFDDIKKEKLKEFNLTSDFINIKHFVNTGEFIIDNNETEDKIMFLLNDKLIGKSNDIINFKERKQSLRGSGLITGYYTGFKEDNKEFEYIELLFWIDFEQQEFKVRLRVTPKEDVDIKEMEDSTIAVLINGEKKELNLDIGKEKQEFVFNI